MIMNKLFLISIFNLIICFSVFSQGSVTINLKNADQLKGKSFYIRFYQGLEIPVLDSSKFDGINPVKLNITGNVLPGVYEVYFGNQLYPFILTQKDPQIIIDIDNSQSNKFIVPPVNNENKAFSELLNSFMEMNGKMQSAYSKYVVSSKDDTINYKKQTKATDSLNQVFADESEKISKKYKGTYTAEVLSKILVITMSKELMGSINLGLRTNYILDHFFDNWNFNDERFIYNPFIREQLKFYLNSIYPKENDYDKNPAERLTKSVNIIMSRSLQNNTVKEFTVNYLIDYYLMKGPGEIILFIYDNYYEACTLELNEKTLERIKQLKNVKPGNKAPDFTIKNETGKDISLNSIIGKGPVMILFWASWCNHCKAEAPKYAEVFNEFKSKGFQTIAVSLDDDKNQWLYAINLYKLSGWINVCDFKKFNSDVAREYFIYNTPTMFLLDKEGKILFKNIRPEELRKQLEIIYKN